MSIGMKARNKVSGETVYLHIHNLDEFITCEAESYIFVWTHDDSGEEKPAGIVKKWNLEEFVILDKLGNPI